jgi:hypothetical protein
MDQSVSDIAENWYSRLNKLKDYNQREDLTLKQKIRSQILILALADRLIQLLQHYHKATLPRLKSSDTFKSGGIAILEKRQHVYEHYMLRKNESAVDHAKRIIKNFPHTTMHKSD